MCSRLIAAWKGDAKDGWGTYSWQSKGEVYEGEWEANAQHGFGTQHFANKDVYEGKWVSDAMEGKGTMSYANGDVYEGMWVRKRRARACPAVGRV